MMKTTEAAKEFVRVYFKEVSHEDFQRRLKEANPWMEAERPQAAAPKSKPSQKLEKPAQRANSGRRKKK